MANLVMPSIHIAFQEKARTFISRANNSNVALVLAGSTSISGLFEFSTASDVPSTWSAENKAAVNDAFLGYKNSPKKVYCYLFSSTSPSSEDWTDCQNVLRTKNFITLASYLGEDSSATVNTQLIAYAKSEEKFFYVAYNPTTAPDSEWVVNLTNTTFKSGDTAVDPETSTPYFAGLIAGTPLTISCTYAPVKYTDCNYLTAAQRDAAVTAGKFFVWHDGEKCKVARGITSLTTTTVEKGDQFKKIKIVSTMKQINDDITKTAQDEWIGKLPNTFGNRGLLISSIQNYFRGLQLDNIISTYTVDIDVEAQRTYIGSAAETMTEQEIREYNCGSNVYLIATLGMVDAIEDITLNITI